MPHNHLIDLKAFHSSLANAAGRVASIAERGDAGSEGHTVLSEAIGELQLELEELQVAHEELRMQNEALLVMANELATERERYRSLFENAPESYITTNSDGVIIEANRSACTALNIDLKYLQGKILASFVPTANRKEFRATLLRLKSGDTRLEEEITLKPRKADEPVLFSASIVTVRGRSSDSLEIRWLLRPAETSHDGVETEGASVSGAPELEVQADNSEAPALFDKYVKAQNVHSELHRLQSPEAVLEFLSEHSAELAGHHCFISLLSPDRKRLIPITAASRGQKSNGMVSQFKKAKSQAVAKNIAETVLKSGEPCVISNGDAADAGMADVRIQKGPVNMLIVPLRTDKTILGLLTLIREPGDKDYSKNELIIVQNLADHAASILQNHHLSEQVYGTAAAQAERGNFTVALCKDLQGPMHAILGYASMLTEAQSDLSPELVVQDATVITEAAIYVNSVLTEFLELAQVEMGSIPYRPERTSVNELMYGVEVELEAAYHSRNMRVMMNPDSQGMNLMIDPVWARRAMSRGIKFAQQVAEDFHLVCEVDEDTVWLVVNCTGLADGIDAARRAAAEEQAHFSTDPSLYLQNVNFRANLRLMFARRLCEVTQARFQVDFPDEGPDVVVRVGFPLGK